MRHQSARHIAFFSAVQESTPFAHLHIAPAVDPITFPLIDDRERLALAIAVQSELYTMPSVETCWYGLESFQGSPFSNTEDL